MTEKQILSEIKSVNVESLENGMTIMDHFFKVKHQYPAESLFLHIPDNSVKWYYNYTEKLLRRVEVDFKQINETAESKHSENEHWFDAISDEDESVIPFTAGQFASKIVVYDDWHKLITYDEETGHYECFFVDIPENVAKAVCNDQMLVFDDIANETSNDEVITIEEAMEEDDDFAKACTKLANWMLKNDIIPELRFTRIAEGIKLDMIQSMLFTGTEEDKVDELPPPDSL